MGVGWFGPGGGGAIFRKAKTKSERLFASQRGELEQQIGYSPRSGADKKKQFCNSPRSGANKRFRFIIRPAADYVTRHLIGQFW